MKSGREKAIKSLMNLRLVSFSGKIWSPLCWFQVRAESNEFQGFHSERENFNPSFVI